MNGHDAIKASFPRAAISAVGLAHPKSPGQQALVTKKSRCCVVVATYLLHTVHVERSRDRPRQMFGPSSTNA